jgi:hypothetical protein
MKKNNKELSALCMTQYGINSVILFNHNEIEELIDEFESTDDALWCEGNGKEYMFGFMKYNLINEDKYFDAHKDKAVIGDERWDSFCTDCLILSALGTYLYGNPIMLMHPKSYAENFAHASILATNGEMPVLMKDIPILQ